MKAFQWCVAALVFAGGSVLASENGWHPASGPLKTRWDADVSPDKVWAEYPRLQKRWKGARTLLHFGAVDWKATVFVNGIKVGEHQGGYDSFTLDITDAVNKSGSQEISIAVFDPTDAGQPHGKQSRAPGGIVYTPSSGIWQTVWLEPVPQASIADLKITPDVDNGVLRLSATGAGTGADDIIEAVAYQKGSEAGRVTGRIGTELQLPVPRAILWSPEKPLLYQVKIKLRRSGKMVDAVDSYFGMRKVSLGKDEKGITRPM